MMMMMNGIDIGLVFINRLDADADADTDVVSMRWDGIGWREKELQFQ